MEVSRVLRELETEGVPTENLIKVVSRLTAKLEKVLLGGQNAHRLLFNFSHHNVA